MLKRIFCYLVKAIVFIVGISFFLFFFGPSINAIKVKMSSNFVAHYTTSRPLFAGGWSSVSRPLINKERIYFCGGYGWWENDIHLIALDKTAKKIWQNKIVKPCENFSMNNAYLAYGQTYQAKKHKDEDNKISNFVNKNRVVLTEMIDGKSLEIDEAKLIGLTNKNLYFTRGKNKDLYQYNINNKSEYFMPIRGARTLEILNNDIYIFTSNSMYKLENENNKPQLILENKNFSYHTTSKNNHICYILEGSNRNENSLECLNINTNKAQNLGNAYIGLYLEIVEDKVFWPDNERRLNHFSFTENTHKVYPNIKFSRFYGIKNGIIIASDAHIAYAIDSDAMQTVWKEQFPGWIKGMAQDNGKVIITEDQGGLYILSSPIGGHR